MALSYFIIMAHAIITMIIIVIIYLLWLLLGTYYYYYVRVFFSGETLHAYLLCVGTQ